jgi:hypothetical protein
VQLQFDIAKHLNRVIVIVLWVLNSDDELTLESHLVRRDVYFRSLDRIICINYNSYLVIITESILKGGDQRVDDHLRYQGDIVDLEHPGGMEGGQG